MWEPLPVLAAGGAGAEFSSPFGLKLELKRLRRIGGRFAGRRKLAAT